MLLNESGLENHFREPQGRIRTARSCRDVPRVAGWTLFLTRGHRQSRHSYRHSSGMRGHLRLDQRYGLQDRVFLSDVRQWWNCKQAPGGSSRNDLFVSSVPK